MRTALALVACLLAGCASTEPAPSGPGVELTQVPFFPQQAYQCGPAALATVLVHSGVTTSPEALTDATFIPGREGTLQAELVAAARQQGRTPLPIPGDAGALLRELRAGNPVLVLQNLGIDALPRWHYAVVVGYADGAWLLRSGTEQRRREAHAAFMRSWGKSGFWARVVTRPGELPASAGAGEVLTSLAASESRLPAAAALASWEAALRRWPGDNRLLFATANANRRAGDELRAARLFQRLLRRDAGHLAARNNFADLLLAAGCPDRADTVLAPARAATTDNPGPLGQAIRATAREIAAAPAAVDCRLP